MSGKSPKSFVYNRLDALCFHRPSDSTEEKNKIEKPKGAVPNFGLPKWKLISLERKIPVISAPKNAYHYSRGKLGEELWVKSEWPKFNTEDPYCYNFNFPYNSLHDRCLVSFFKSPKNIQHLINVGLLSDNLDILCTIQEYNTYRKYLQRLHSEKVTDEIRKRKHRTGGLSEEVKKAIAERREEKEKLRSLCKQKIEKARLDVIEKARKRFKEEEESVKKCIIRKQEIWKLQQEKNNQKTLRIKNRLKALAYDKKLKDISLLWNLRRKDLQRQKCIKAMENQNTKDFKLKQKWENLIKFQEEQVHKEEILQSAMKAEREKFLEMYNAKIAKEQRRMEKLFKDAKKFTKCSISRHTSGRDTICCKKYMKDGEDNTDDIQKILSTIKPYSRFAVRKLLKDNSKNG